MTDNDSYWKRIENLPDPIRIGHDLVKVKLRIPKAECRLVFYSHITGEEIPKLEIPTHWQLFHSTIEDFEFHVREVYDDMVSDYYLISYRLYWGDLTPLAKYYVPFSDEDSFFKRSHITYSYL